MLIHDTNENGQNAIVVWSPIPGSSQQFALDTRAQHTLYHGSRGPGKTDTQLMRFRRFVGQGYGPFWKGIIFDKQYKSLEDLIGKSVRWFYAFEDGARFLSGSGDLKWVWPSGEELLFRQAETVKDYDKYHGQEYAFIGFNELTKYPASDVYDKMATLNRSSFRPQDYPQIDGEGNSFLLPEIPLQMFSTTNPSGVGHAWVKKRFISCAPYGKVVKTEIDVFNPRTQKEETVTKTQVAIFGSYKENIYLAPEYVAELERITDENLRKAWLYGDWDVATGGALDDVWRRATHILPRFPVPSGWRIDRSFDWGSTHPASVGWWAECNGEEVILPNELGRERNKKFCPPAGTLIQIAELYFTKEIGSNKGLRWSASDIAKKILQVDKYLVEAKWVNSSIWPGPADNQISDTREIDVDTIEKKMADEGVRWTKSDKSPGSRKIGLQLIRDRLQASLQGELPGIYFMNNCIASIETIPILPRDEIKVDDVDTQAEDHPYDMARYRVLAGANRTATNLNARVAG